MKVNSKVIALMTALAAGVAAAAPTGTTAGTPITNTAYADFTDPSTGSAAATVPSNEVTTTVLPKPGFDVIFQGNTPTDGGTQNDLTTTTKILTGTAGGTFSTVYTVVNNGNVALTVDLTANEAGATAGQTVVYYLADAAGNPTGSAIKTVTVPVTGTGTVNIVQVITTPSTAASSSVFGASPVGTVTGTGLTVNGYDTNVTAQEDAKTAGSDLQFTKVLLYGMDNNPLPTTTPANPVNPDGTTLTNPPTTATVQVPTLGSGYTDPTLDTPPTQGTTGYTDTAGTPIVVNTSGDVQIAYPKADVDNTDPANTTGNTNSTAGTADSVTFLNTLSNTGSAPDKIQLFPIDAVNADGTLKTGYSFDSATATFTYPDGTKVQFLDPAGNVIPTATGALFPTLTVPAGSTAYYGTKVTYPDPTDSALTSPIVVQIGADSLSDSDVQPNATTTDKIYPAAAQFGDSTSAQGTVPTPAPTQTVTPYGNYPSGDPTTSPDSTDGTAVFPMHVANMGQYADSYKLSATVPGMTGATVKYYYLDPTSNTMVELSKDTSGNYVTPVIASGAELKVYAVINVPQNTPVGTYTVSQTAVGEYSTISMSDLNDNIVVAKPGNLAVAKFVYDGTTQAGATPINGIGNNIGYNASPSTSPTSALPTSDIKYQIIAKNSYPVGIANFMLSDSVPTNTTFKSVSGTDSAGGTVIYSTDGSTWSKVAPTSTTTTKVWVAIDDAGTAGEQPGALSSNGGTLTVDFTVTVK